MLDVESHGDVTRIVLSSRRSRVVGLTVSAYLVRGVLVDSGFPAVGAEVEAFVRERRPRGAMLTHRHEDHAGNAERLARLGVPIAASDETLSAIRAPGPIGFYRRFTWHAMPPLASRAERFDDESLRLVHLPGHSTDHHGVWDAETRTLFGGDLFLGVKVRVAHPGEHPRELARSLRRASALGPRRLFDAHRGPVPDPVGALEAKADWLETTIERIERRVVQGWSDRAIRRDVLGGEELAGWFSRGDYSRGNFVRSVRRDFLAGDAG